MKILFLGDSITDAGKWREMPFDNLASLGMGYVRSIANTLFSEIPRKYSLINAGISGDRIVDLYARIKKDVWNHSPDVMSVLVGVNDVWHEIESQNGVDIERLGVRTKKLDRKTVLRRKYVHRERKREGIGSI